MNRTTRRQFVRSSVAATVAAAGAIAAPAVMAQGAKGANERIGVAGQEAGFDWRQLV